MRKPHCLVLLFACGAATFQLRAQESFGSVANWRPTAALNKARAKACALRLADGRVLVTGGTDSSNGILASAELFRARPPAERFEEAPSLQFARAGHACVLLPDGRVLVAGGEATEEASASEVYDPTLLAWTAIPSTLPARRGPGLTATPLADGRILIAGGGLSELEIFDPETNQLELVPGLLSPPRQHHTATLLPDGRVLIAGGLVDGKSVASAELFDPSTATLIVAASLQEARSYHTATLLLNSRVLIAGGASGTEERTSLEVFIPGRDIFETTEAQLQQGRRDHIAVRAENSGIVLLAGGSAKGEFLSSSEVFDPSDNRVLPAGALTAPRTLMTGAALEDGSILAIGGQNADGASPNCGVLTSLIQIALSQARYRPLETVVMRITLASTIASGLPLTLQLARINSVSGETTVVSDRLLVRTLTVTGTITATPIFNVRRDDAGFDFVLTVTNNSREAAIRAIVVQNGFTVRLATTLTMAPSLPALVNQPMSAQLGLTADGTPVAMGGTFTLTVGSRSASVISLSQISAASGAKLAVCCEAVPGSISVTGRYSGNRFLDAASASTILAIGSGVPTVAIPPARLVLQQTGQVLVEVRFDAGTLDPVNAPRGSVTLLKNGTAFSTVPLSNNLALDTGGPRGALFNYTPTLFDCRNNVCFTARYEGDSRYPAVTSSPACLAVGPAIPLLTFDVRPTYTLGETQTLSVRLVWPNNVGIVGRTVNVTSGTRAIATITLQPDPTGLGLASGQAAVRLPFQVGSLDFVYPASGDLASATTGLRLTMNPISTTLTPSVALRATPPTNPFSINYTLRANTGGQPLPSNTPVGGTIQFFDGTELLATQMVPTVLLPFIEDGTSNTITLEPVSVTGTLTNVIRPLGQRTIRVRFTGGAAFSASEGTIVVTVQ